ncbi:MAG: argininosuccinate lyase [Betaproteobacteria bacterium]|nr:argininosuccinate lyase [Betaproteobacteria bacterium]
MSPTRHPVVAACALLLAGAAHAQTTAPAGTSPMPAIVANHCTTADACLAQMTRQLVVQRGATSALARSQDNFYWFGRINMASAVMLTEQKIIPPELAGPIARGVAHAIDQATRPGFVRPTDVLVTEKIITDFAGPDATLIHTGRSRQDMHPTLTLGQLRVETLDFADALAALRQQLLEMAAQHAETFVPAYTNGVQAMPISLGQYLHAYADSFGRDGERLRQAWTRVNKSPMGAAVLANSSWPLDRVRLAELLGFDGPGTNSYDATQINPVDVALEVVNIAGSVALRVGALMQDVHVQYHQTRPWLLLAPGRTYSSSAMPQKANPGVIQNTRALASDVVGSVQQVVLRAHNVTPGMIDYKYSWTAGQGATFVKATQMLRDATDVMASLRVDAKRSLEELESDWTTSMELAETLQREHKVPFRVGHHFASEVVKHAKAHQLLPRAFPYDEAVRIYAEAGHKYQVSDAKLPLDESTFRATLSPENMVRTRVGIGGPQPAEVRRMHGEARKTLDGDRAWVAERRKALADAEAKLNSAFAELLKR